MKVVGFALLCHVALGLAVPLSSPLTYAKVMMKALEKDEIECPEQYTPDCTDMRTCTLPADQFGCPTGSFCMALTMTLPDNTVCNTLCPKHECAKDERYCVGGHETDTGCPKDDFCLSKLDDNGYEQQCDEACEKGQIQCPDRIYDENGTPQPKKCVSNLNECPTAHDDGTKYDENGCTVHAEEHCAGTLCNGNFCSEYCRNPDTCIEDGNNVDENGCPRQCPEGGCQIYEFECAITYNEVGCPNPKKCVLHPSQCDKTEFQKDTGCPVFETTCDDETEILCSSPKTTLGKIYQDMGIPLPQGANDAQICDDKQVCVSKLTTSARDTECPVEQCPPAECPAGQQLCDMGFEKGTGCPKQADCAIECPEITIDDRGCEIFEAASCEADETPCEPIYDQSGCKEAPQCIPNDGSCDCPAETFDLNGCLLEKAQNNVPEGLVCGDLMNKCFMGYDQDGCGKGFQCLEKFCEDYPECELACPTVCAQNKRTCKVPDSDGCPAADECVDLTYENERDPVYGGTVTCENFCEPVCSNVETKCPATFDKNGCKEVQQCVDENMGGKCPESSYDENGCEVFDVTCNNNEQKCDGGFDERNCPKKPTCQPKDGVCPVVCEYDEMLCEYGTATFPHISDPVEVGKVCVKRKVTGGIYNAEDCDNVCPPQCDWITEKAVFGGYDKTSGCKLQDKCIDKSADYHATLNAIRTCEE